MTTISSSGLHSLATLIKRLEAAASRFEDIAALPLVVDSSKHQSRSSIPGRPSADVTDYGSSSPTHAPSTHSASTVTPSTIQPPVPPSGPVETPRSVIAFKENVIDAKLKPFIDLNKGFAPPSVLETLAMVEKQYTILCEFIGLAAACQKPTQETLATMLAPFQEAITNVSRAKEVHRKERDWFSHLTVLSEGAPAIGWVVAPKPTTFVSEIKDSVMYWGNRIKKEFKDQDRKHVDWVNQYIGILDAMYDYNKEFHTTGLTWNPRGLSTSQYKPAGQVASPSGPPPPPPPPPPPAVTPGSAPAPASSAGGAAAVFAQLNRGEEVTKGLRKVDKSEMTHKNPALRASAVVPASSAPSPTLGKKPIKPSKPHALAGKKPPKFQLEDNKWLIEFQENESLNVDDVELNHVVNIFNCKSTTVFIKGKVNTVNIVNSVKTSVLIQSVISVVTVTNSPSFQIQILGAVPMIQLDSTDSGQVYLSKDSLNAEITTAKCSAINVSIPIGEDEGDFREQPVPEMFKSVVQDGKLVTTIVEHTG